MEENNEQGLPKKKVKTILIVGFCGTPLSSVAKETLERLSKDGDKVVLVDSLDDVKEGDVDEETLTHLKKKKKDPFGPEPMKITNPYDGLPPINQYFPSDNNPWPSSKGRKWKKRW